MKTDFQNVLFTDKPRVTLDAPDGWAKTWSPTGAAISPRVYCQQEIEGVTFLAVIIGDKIIKPFRAHMPSKHIIFKKAFISLAVRPAFTSLNDNVLPRIF